MPHSHDLSSRMESGDADEYEQGAAWWLGRRYRDRMEKNLNCEPERDDVYDNVPAALKTQAMTED